MYLLLSKMKMSLLIYIVVLMSCVSCTFESEGVYTDDTSEEYELYDYYIDEYGNEGIVAARLYDSSSYELCRIIVISLDETCLPWGPTGEVIYKRDVYNKNEFSQPEFGVAMHQEMMSLGVEKFPSQNWCNQKNKGEKYPRAGSWRLPTKKEYDFIFGDGGAKVEKLNNALRSVGAITIKTENFYWTCVEDYDGYVSIKDLESDYDPENRAIIMTCNNTTQGYKDRWLKTNRYYVRAIKYIYYKE